MSSIRSFTLLGALGALALLAIPGCFGGGADDYGTGARLSVDYFADTDVVGFHYIVENVSCAGEPIVPTTVEFNVDLVDGIFPAMITHISSVLDADSRHLGADLFLSTEPGCYMITAIPASGFDPTTGGFIPSEDCSVASVGPIEVVDGETTEAPPMISQCVGDPIGAFDASVLLNHPPVISVEIDEKYNYECEAVEACVTAFDYDDDPISFSFFKNSGPGLFHLDQGTPEVIGFEEGHRVWQQCATIVSRFTATYDMGVTVWDHTADGSKFEDVTGEPSHDDFSFPIYTNWIEDPKCFDDLGNLVDAAGSSVVRWPGCAWTTAEQFYCSGAYSIDPAVEAFLCDGTDLLEENLYPLCD